VEDQPTLTNVVFEDAGFDAQFVRALDTIPSGGDDFAEAFITVLLTTGENDPRGRDAQNLYDALTGPKEHVQFTHAEIAGQHDESGAAVLFSQRAFDWLDIMLGQ
jgi:hypothetical protein